MTSKRLGWWVIGALAAEFAVGSCTPDGVSSTGPLPAPPPSDNSAVVVSEPVWFNMESMAPLSASELGSATLLELDAGSQTEVCFVSYAPGSIPQGDSIEVKNLNRDLLIGAPMVDGGIDPMAIPASVGDTLQITVFRQGLIFEMQARAVPDESPPKVVRTDPPPGRTRVPLNAQIVVTFSEPMEPRTMQPEVIQLLRNGEPILGNVVLGANGWEAWFIPTALLEPNAGYQLVVSTGAADLSGDELEQSVEVPFETGTELVPVTRIAMSVLGTLLRGETEVLGLAFPVDDRGHGVLDALVQWSSSDSTVVQVDSAHLVALGQTAVWVTAKHSGSAQLRASFGGVVGTAEVVVTAFASFTSVVVGDSTSCALDTGGQAYCWGLSFAFSSNSRVDGVPSAFAAEQQFRSLAVGNKQGCGVVASYNENAGCWGIVSIPGGWLIMGGPVPLNGYTGSVHSYTSITGGGRSSSNGHSCAIDVGGTAFCWGSNAEGQLGDGNFYWSSPFFDAAVNRVDIQPVVVAGGHVYQSLSAGGDHTCGITVGGQAYCWGNNASGQLGYSVSGSSPTPGPVSGGLAFQALAAGQDHTCAVTVGGEAYCWGSGQRGQLGTGGMSTATPARVQGGMTFMAISAGALHTCAVTSSGQAYCWGENSSGQLGNGTTISRSAPVLVQGGLSFTSVSAGGAHTCGMTTDGKVYCWGDNSAGQLGINSQANRTTPALVLGQP